MDIDEANRILEQQAREGDINALTDQQQEATRIINEAYQQSQQRLEEAQRSGEAPLDASVYGVSNAGYSYVKSEEVNKQVAERGREFRQQVQERTQAKQEREQALKPLEQYRTGQGYELSKAIKEGKIEDIRKAQKAGVFKAEDVVDAQIEAAEPPKYVTKEEPKAISLPKGSKISGLAEIKGAGKLVSGGPVTSTQQMSEEELAKMHTLQEKVFWNSFGMIPVYGTAIMIAAKMPGRSIAVSAAGDLLIGVPIPSLSVLKNIGKIPGLAKVELALRTGRNAELKSLRAVANKEITSAYKGMIRAGDDYAENLAEIKATEKLIKTRPGGALNEDLVTLEQAQAKSKNLKINSYNAANKFAKAQQASDPEHLLSNYGSKYSRAIESTVEHIYQPKIKNIPKIINDIKIARQELDDIIEHKTEGQVSKQITKVMELQNQLNVARSGQIVSATIRRGAIDGEANQLLKQSMEEQSKTTRDAIKSRIKALRTEDKQLARQQAQALKNLEITWGEPIRRSGGGGVSVLSPPKIKPGPYIGGSGGVRTLAKSPLMPAVAGMKIIAQGDDWVEYSIPSVKPLEVPGKKTMPVEPQPMWEGVTTIANPEAPPTIVPVEPKPHEPRPGKITWTPRVVIAPQLQPQELVVIMAKSSTTPQQQARVSQEAANKYKELVSTGESSKSAIKSVTKLYPAVRLQQITSTKLEQVVKQATRISPATQTIPVTKTPIFPVTPIPPVIPPPPTPPPPPKIPHAGMAADKEKRQAIKEAKGSAASWPQGELDGKTVWHTIILFPNNKTRHIIVLGDRPEGAEYYPGPREAYRSISLLWGKGPSKPVTVEGGAIDPTIHPTMGGKKVTITFEQDKRYAKQRHFPQNKTRVKQSDLAEDIEEVTKGGVTRRHIRIE